LTLLDESECWIGVWPFVETLLRLAASAPVRACPRPAAWGGGQIQIAFSGAPKRTLTLHSRLS
jgi:hypothetical protein